MNPTNATIEAIFQLECHCCDCVFETTVADESIEEQWAAIREAKAQGWFLTNTLHMPFAAHYVGNLRTKN